MGQFHKTFTSVAIVSEIEHNSLANSYTCKLHLKKFHWIGPSFLYQFSLLGQV